VSVEPTWAEISVSALEHNLSEVRRLVGPQTEIMAVVKANAYGHGLVPAARVFAGKGADWLGVARASEAVELRRAGLSLPILVLGYTPPEQYPYLLDYNITQTIYDFELARMLSEAAGERGQTAKVHLKVDTGMGRLGFLLERDIYARILEITELPSIEVDGLFTHFAAADAADKTYTRRQFDAFVELTCHLGQDGIDIPYLHVANSAATIDLPESHMNLVRVGLMLYGLYPSKYVNKTRVDLQPAMSLKSRVGMVKNVPAGTFVSYGCTYVTPAPTTLATIPIGYADGYTRLLSNKGEVLIRGQRAPVVGRVCMDQIIVDVGHIPGVQVGDEVVMYGRQGDAVLPVEEVAEKIGTITYEVLCAVTARVPRVYVE